MTCCHVNVGTNIIYIYTYSYQENDQTINLCDIHTFFSEEKPSTLLMVHPMYIISRSMHVFLLKYQYSCL